LIHYRPFLNTDPPALVRLWNEALPSLGVARPLRVHELDEHAFNSAIFDREGLIVAIREGRPVGFAHAGFGPPDPIEQSPPLALCQSLGTVAMLVIDPAHAHPHLAQGLILAAERYLRTHGARVLYAGSLYPLNPFYWGIYGGSEGAGIVSSHASFILAVTQLGYEPVSTVVSLQYDVATLEPRDPRFILIRRQTMIDHEEDVVPENWWINLALGKLHLTRIRLLNRADGSELARVTTWDMNAFGRQDGRPRVGLIGLKVAPTHRGKGYGKYLVCELIRWARDRSIALIETQAMATNEAALSLYNTVGFEAFDQSQLYRLPAALLERSDTIST
jgi:ribosomal protein S18 acetylase RimI-like enzyme